MAEHGAEHGAKHGAAGPVPAIRASRSRKDWMQDERIFQLWSNGRTGGASALVVGESLGMGAPWRMVWHWLEV